MIERGANPFIVPYNGKTQYWEQNLHEQNLSNLPTTKSAYFLTRPLVGNDGNKTEFCDPWFYRNGVFDGKFDSAIGQGASGRVISGKWYGKKAAFKFVEIENQKIQKISDSKNVEESLKILEEKLSEMTAIQATKGSKIVQFYGHYR